MIVYRITSEKYASDLSGEGAMLAGGRWNSRGLRMLYTSQFISLSILEILVKVDKFFIPDALSLLAIQIPDESMVSVSISTLKKEWPEHIEYTKWIGDEFLKENQSLVLQVPSAIVSQEHNFLINPLHKQFKKVKIEHSELLNLDKRLLIQ